MKKRIKLSEINVKSFVTEGEEESEETGTTVKDPETKIGCDDND